MDKFLVFTARWWELCHPEAGVWRHWSGDAGSYIWRIQCLYICIWTDRGWQKLYHDGQEWTRARGHYSSGGNCTFYFGLECMQYVSSSINFKKWIKQVPLFEWCLFVFQLCEDLFKRIKEIKCDDVQFSVEVRPQLSCCYFQFWSLHAAKMERFVFP